MSVTLLVAALLGIGLALATTWLRRAERVRMATALADRDAARRSGSDERRLQHPVVDLSRCLGCATCVRACPEEGVLAMVHGQAMVVDGASCLGISACVRSCPTEAIAVTLATSATRTDIPALTPELEAIGTEGLFLAGEVTAHALIRVAIDHGVRVAATVARRLDEEPNPDRTSAGPFDLCIVGAGPAGLACALEATRLGLRFLVLDREPTIGGTVAKYPRQKLVLTEPVDLPLHGRVRQTEFTKEELIAFWQSLVDRHALPIVHGATLESIDRTLDGSILRTADGEYRARYVCLALGRRGTPRTLGVPGEDAPHVASSLLDAQSHHSSDLVVIGGGDSAAEAALGLAAQPGNRITLVHRGEGLPRLKRKNAERIDQAVADSRLEVRLSTEVEAIGQTAVTVRSAAVTAREPLMAAAGVGTGLASLADEDTEQIAADRVFVMIGGTPPTALLEASGVSFDPRLRSAAKDPAGDPADDPQLERGTGLVRALAIAFVLAIATTVFALWHADYYGLALTDRPTHAKHDWLRPARGLGLWFGIGAAVLIVVNLLYLARRLPKTPLRFGSLSTWLESHIATGVLAVLLALLHGAFVAKSTPGGHALTGLAVLLVTGAIGRYLYAAVPRAANGREFDLAQVRAELDAAIAARPVRASALDQRARELIDELTTAQQWQGSFVHRMVTAARQPSRLRAARAELQAIAAHDSTVDSRELLIAVARVRRAQRASAHAAYFEDVRNVLGSWRWMHRWVAVVTVVLVIVHVVYALSYSSSLGTGSLR